MRSILLYFDDLFVFARNPLGCRRNWWSRLNIKTIRWNIAKSNETLHIFVSEQNWSILIDCIATARSSHTHTCRTRTIVYEAWKMEIQTFLKSIAEWTVIIFVVNSPAVIDVCVCEHNSIYHPHAVHGNAKRTNREPGTEHADKNCEYLRAPPSDPNPLHLPGRVRERERGGGEASCIVIFVCVSIHISIGAVIRSTHVSLM